MRYLLLLAIFYSTCGFCLEPLTIGSWNFQWLTAEPSQMGPKRDAQDYHQFNESIRQSQIDILAFAEVGSVNAIRQVIGNGYDIELSHRAFDKLSEGKWRQYTGFAIRKGLVYQRHPDLNLNVNHNNRLRNGVDIEFTTASGKQLRLLAVHLKSGCFTQTKSSSFACQTLARQARQLHRWIVKRNKQKQRFVILGDFNRRMLNVENQWFFHMLQANEHQMKNHLIIINHGASHCWSKNINKHQKVWMSEHKQFIDFILMNKLSAAAYISNSFKEVAASRFATRHFNLSDHCLISAKLKQ